MSDDQSSREAALADFEACRKEFEEAVRRAPDAALRYRPPGEDYALGGLVVHVTDVLQRYGQLIEAIEAAGWQALQAPAGDPSPEDTALIHDGFEGQARALVLEHMRAAHRTLVDAARAGPEASFAQQAPVTFGVSSEPYPTSPANVVGWVRDHYKEHTQQITDLVSAWAKATR